MPQLIAAIGLKVATVFGTTVLSFGAALAIGSVVVAGGLRLLTLSQKQFGLNDPVGVPRNHQLAVRSTSAPRTIVYGEAVVGGPIAYMNTQGVELRSLYIVIVHTGHEIDSYQGWYIDDQFVDATDVDDVESAGDGSVDGDTASTGHGFSPVDSTPVLYLRGHTGAAAQAVDAALDTAFSDIGTNHRGRGCALTVVRAELLEGAEEVWDNSPPQNVRSLIKGKLVYDPRLDSTFPSGSGAHRLATPSTWAWSDNPALVWADYKIDSDLGPGYASAQIDYQDVFDAADDCDVLSTIPPASPTTTEKRFTCNGVLSTTDDFRTNTQKILSSMNGKERYYGGEWHVFASVYPAADFTLTEDDLVGDVIYRQQPERGDRYNVVRGTYFDEDRNHKHSQFLTATDSTLRTNRDNSRTIPKELDLPMTNSEFEAQRIALRVLNQADDTGVLVFPASYAAMDIRIGDTGTVTISELSFAAKVFRVVGIRHVDFRGMELTLKEDASANYTDPIVADYATRTAAGQVIFPTIRSDLSPNVGLLIADPFFRRSIGLWAGQAVDADNYYSFFWGDRNSTSGATAAISRAGGLSGSGALQLSTDGTAGERAYVHSVPGPSSLALAGERVVVHIRVRRTASLVTPDPDTNIIQVSVGLGNPETEEIDNYGGPSTFVINHATVAAWTLNEWKQFDFEQELGTQALALASDSRHAMAEIIVDSDETSAIEFDALTVQRIRLP